MGAMKKMFMPSMPKLPKQPEPVRMAGDPVQMEDERRRAAMEERRRTRKEGRGSTRMTDYGGGILGA